jgi:hypothetical protein
MGSQYPIVGTDKIRVEKNINYQLYKFNFNFKATSLIINLIWDVKTVEYVVYIKISVGMKLALPCTH